MKNEPAIPQRVERCLACGYVLGGLTKDAVCPECSCRERETHIDWGQESMAAAVAFMLSIVALLLVVCVPPISFAMASLSIMFAVIAIAGASPRLRYRSRSRATIALVISVPALILSGIIMHGLSRPSLAFCGR